MAPLDGNDINSSSHISINHIFSFVYSINYYWMLFSVGAALCRERAAQQPPDLPSDTENAGAALRPFRDTRPLLQGTRRHKKGPSKRPEDPCYG
ncbi:hypothetical protein E3U47_17295 [Pseudomonas sp. RIT623]|nr:hypothetical protein E3U47_17295 [Pseudomonas sp. RIT623]